MRFMRLGGSTGGRCDSALYEVGGQYRTCPVSVDTKNSASSSWLWSLWETSEVFQVAAVNAKRFPQTRQNP